MSQRGYNAYSNRRKKDRPFIRFRIKAVAFIVIITFAACFTLYMLDANMNIKKSNSIGFSADSLSASDLTVDAVLQADNDNLSSDSDIAETTTAENTARPETIVNPVPESEPKTNIYLGKCAFVGDSITVGLNTYQFVPAANVFAELGINIRQIGTEKLKTAYGELTAAEWLEQLQPENVYIMLGSNGIEWIPDKEMLEYYSDFVDNVKTTLPDAKIYILSIPPVTSEREQFGEKQILNEDVDKYNSKLLDMANEKKIYYVDINSELKGSDGKFPAEMAASDGLHFVKNTYSIMLDYILSHTAE